jgi:hypothetical protein
MREVHEIPTFACLACLAFLGRGDAAACKETYCVDARQERERSSCTPLTHRCRSFVRCRRSRCLRTRLAITTEHLRHLAPPWPTVCTDERVARLPGTACSDRHRGGAAMHAPCMGAAWTMQRMRAQELRTSAAASPGQARRPPWSCSQPRGRRPRPPARAVAPDACLGGGP